MLISSSGANPYNLVETPQFRKRWSLAVSSRAINPSIAERLLRVIRHILTEDPYRYPLFPASGEAVDIRWLDLFPGSNPRVEIWYSIAEDDRLVYLVSVEIVHSNQRGLPGFEL